jgi:hypothetical protein
MGPMTERLAALGQAKHPDRFEWRDGRWCFIRVANVSGTNVLRVSRQANRFCRTTTFLTRIALQDLLLTENIMDDESKAFINLLSSLLTWEASDR